MEYDLSVAVWVGIIALIGIAVEIGVVMLTYLDLSYERWVEEGRLHSIRDLIEATLEGAVRRVRPVLMTGGSTMAGLLPIMWRTGAGEDGGSRPRKHPVPPLNEMVECRALSSQVGMGNILWSPNIWLSGS